MWLRSSVALAAAGFCLLQTARASAQTIAVTNKTTLFRTDQSGKTDIAPHPQYQPTAVNLQDCREQQQIRFVLSMTDITPGDVVEAWVSETGAACSDVLPRTQAPPQCRKLGVSVPVVATTNVTIPVRDILGTQGAAADGCRHLASATQISVWFLYFRGGTTAAATTSDSVAVTFKTQGPSALTGITLKPGNEHLTVGFEPIGGGSDGGGGVADVTRVFAYCDTAPTGASSTTTQTCPDASSTDSGADADATVDAGCTTSTGGAGSIPPPSGIGSDGVACQNQAFAQSGGTRITPDADFDAKYKCGEAGGTTATTITTGSVPNGQTVAVAVAGVDSYGNVGELSDAFCQYGELTSDFWNQYKNEGGGSGGGFCAVGPNGMPASSFAVLGLGVAVAISLARKNGQKKKKGNGR